MLISYYEDGTSARREMEPLLVALMGLNCVLSSVILFAWTYIAYFVAEPLSWATWMPISRGSGFVGVLDYPFVLLWLLPLIGAFGGWAGRKSGNKVLAYAFVAVPVLMLLMIFGWFHLAPGEWR
jgi:hypothetical protein